MTKLTDKQKAFVDEYLVDLNATQAAIRAGYSKKTARYIGYENLTKPHIQAGIDKALDARSERTQITADRILEEIAKVGFQNVQDIFTGADCIKAISSLPEDIAACVQSVEVVRKPSADRDEDGNMVYDHVHKIRLNDKLKALEMLGRHLVLFSDRVVHDGEIITKIERTIVHPKPANS